MKDAPSGSLRVGVAGLGFGAAVHVPGFRAAGAEVVALAGTRKSKAQEIAERLGITSSYEHWEDLLSADIDVVSLALPPDENEKALRASLERNLPVMSEKPVATSSRAARSLVELAGRSTTSVDFQFGELRTFARLKELVRGRGRGSFEQVEIEWTVHSWAHRNKSWSWKTDGDRGGGVLSLLGSHSLFLIDDIFGPIRSIGAKLDNQATAAFAPPGMAAAEDRAILDLDCGDVRVRAAIANSGPAPARHIWQVAGSIGRIEARNLSDDYVSGFRLMDLESDKVLVSETPHSSDGRIPPFIRLARRFLEAARRNGQCYPDISAGARVQELMDAVRCADATGGVVQISS